VNGGQRGAAPDPAGLPIVPQRLVLVVPSDASRDSRTDRIAASIAARGHTVTIIARASATGSCDEDEGGAVGIRVRTVHVACDPIDGLPLPGSVRDAIPRLGGARRSATTASSDRVSDSAAPSARGYQPAISRLRGIIRESRRLVTFGLTIRAQARSAVEVDEGADLYHGMAFQGIPVALRLARHSGGAALYDIRDIYLDARNLARLPRTIRHGLRWVERRWIRQADATLTVNGACASLIERRYGRRPAVVMNCPVRRAGRRPHSDLVRDALGLSATDRVAMYHGGLTIGRGLPRTIEAMADPRLVDVHFVLMGWGEEESALRRSATDPAVQGRIHFLPPVAPRDVVDWVSSVDVSIMAIDPSTLNHRLSTPNKLFEALAAGVPVVASDFPPIRHIVVDDPEGPLGAVCDPTDPKAIAQAVVTILDLEQGAAADLRERCARAARERYSWESQLPSLLEAYRAATGRPW
jgi:glycosyltransferase involved in cell wall biosynthesis